MTPRARPTRPLRGALTLYASEPDVVAEMLALAAELEASPMAPAGRRLRRLVARITVVPAEREPVQMALPMRGCHGD